MIDKMEILKQTPLFQHFPENLLQYFVDTCEERIFPAEEVIFVEMTEGDEIYLLVEGKVSVQLAMANEDAGFNIITLNPGEVIGEMAFIEEGLRAATVIAETNVLLLTWKASVWRKICETEPTIGYPLVLNIAKILCRRLRFMNQKIFDNALWGFM